MSSWEDNKARRSDRYGLIEHFCEHGVGHPNPGSALWVAEGVVTDVSDSEEVKREYESQLVHGCDGCCEVDDFPSLWDSLRVAHAIVRRQN